MNYDLPPQAIDAECSLLGALLIGGEKAWDRVMEVIAESDFYLAQHRIIFRHMKALADKSSPIDVVTLSDAMDAAKDSEMSGGIGYLGEMANAVHSAANILGYAEIVVEKSRLRALMEFGESAIQLALSAGKATANERIDESFGKMLALSEGGSSGDEPRHIADVLENVLSSIDDRMNGRLSRGVNTGFHNLDVLLDGMKAGDLIIVAGRPSMGKTAFALNIAETVALSGTPTLVFSFEMGDQQLAQRTLSSVSGVHGGRLASGDMSEEEWDRVGAALSKLKTAPLVIDQNVNLSPAQMRARARRMKVHGGLGLIVIDYLQLMRGTGNNRNEELGDITRSLKLMARDLKVPVICLSQLSRKVEERTDKRPMLSDLRESGSIEQDADSVMMVYRDDYYDPDSDWKGVAEILVRKNRMGACGDAKLIFRAECSRFENADMGAIAEIASRAPTKQVSRRRSGFDG